MAVDSDPMSLRVDSLHQMLILFNLAPDQEKRRADFVLCQHVQHPRRVARMRTIVEGEGDLAARWVAAPERIGVAGLHPCVEAEEQRGEHQ